VWGKETRLRGTGGWRSTRIRGCSSPARRRVLIDGHPGSRFERCVSSTMEGLPPLEPDTQTAMHVPSRAESRPSRTEVKMRAEGPRGLRGLRGVALEPRVPPIGECGCRRLDPLSPVPASAARGGVRGPGGPPPRSEDPKRARRGLEPQKLRPGGPYPTWRRAESDLFEHRYDGRGRDADPELQELPSDPEVASPGVLPAHPKESGV
jgi:hypothetical protein